jgi:hypothetical protein
MNTANENGVAKIIRAMDEEFMRLIAAWDFKHKIQLLDIAGQ